jgi:recombination associated protein RdgC
MWFRNLLIYRFPRNWKTPAKNVDAQLAKFSLQGCGNSDSISLGWVPPCEKGGLVHSVNHQWLLALGVEKKLLPTTVVRQFANDRAKEIEEREGRKLGRKEMRELREAITAELLPRAFVNRRTTFGWIDPVNGWVVVDAGSQAKGDEFIGHLRKSVEGIPVLALKLAHSPAGLMTAWIGENEAPAGFSLDQDLELRSPDEGVVRYAKHPLDGDEVRQHIAAGKIATRVGMTWADRISFVLTEAMQVKRVAFLDVIKEASEGQSDDDAERFDLDFALMSGELARLLDDLVEALGGEQPAA